ncbi:MAG: hypothetical protein CMH83_00590 [Nocardioides sp.]|nr:hypothetical protein [Nocardioides sp.]
MAARGADGAGLTSRTRLLLVVAALVVSVVCLVVLGARLAGATDSSASVGDRLRQLVVGGEAATSYDTATAEEAMSTADQFVLRLNTYGPGDLDDQNAMPDYVARVEEVMTSKFQVDFEENVGVAEQVVAQSGYAREAELTATGVETIDPDSASVLVAASLTSSYPDPDTEGERLQYGPDQLRWQVSLVLVDGTWLVDDYAPVAAAGGEDLLGGTDAPTDVPTEAPTATSVPAPSDGASSGAGEGS